MNRNSHCTMLVPSPVGEGTRNPRNQENTTPNQATYANISERHF